MDKVTYGKVDVVWDKEYHNYSYTKQPLKEEEMKNWRSLGYYHESFSGGMYDSRNPMPDWTLIQQHKKLRDMYTAYLTEQEKYKAWEVLSGQR